MIVGLMLLSSYGAGLVFGAIGGRWAIGGEIVKCRPVDSLNLRR
jgi:hypothetical protein